MAQIAIAGTPFPRPRSLVDQEALLDSEQGTGARRAQRLRKYRAAVGLNHARDRLLDPIPTTLIGAQTINPYDRQRPAICANGQPPGCANGQPPGALASGS
jgi:hypothetical protein